MHKPSSVRDYVIAILIASSLMTFMGLYLFVRRGYFFDAPATADTLYVPNKVLANAAIIMLAFTFLIGPIVRYFDRFDKWLGYRKEIGIVGGFLAFFHVIISSYFLPLKFPPAKIESWEFTAGSIGMFLLICLFIISFKKAVDLLGGNLWWFLQRWGLRLVMLFVLIHVSLMKWSGWIKWLKQGGSVAPTAELANPQMPGLGILAMLFVVWVVILRLYESAFIFKDCGLSVKEISPDAALKVRGRRFFIGSFLVLITLYFLVITRWMW